MRRNLSLFRLTASVAMTALLFDAALPPGAVAQPAPPPLPQPYTTQPPQNQADPPARVGRVARLAGSVSFRTEGDDQWTAASVNYPVSTGETFWTEPSASAELEISDSRIVLAPTTEFDIATLDPDGLQSVAAQGEAYIHLRDIAPSEAWSVQTPRGLVHLNTAGRYHVSVGSTEQPTRVTVLDGSAQIDGPNVTLQVASGQTATIDGTTTFEGSVGPAVKDAFLIASLDAERPPPAPIPSAPIPPQVAVMPGGSDLTGYGNWAEAPEYGQVWYPPVSSGWVPYREGHWAYVAPWGWTWIDDAPWGFAPFHYGRWIEIGGRWAWTPGRYAESSRPVYAPALVAFIGLGAGAALGAALASRSIGWVPLGPGESFHPWYHASDRYVQNVNVSHVTNNTNITTNNVTANTFVNQHAATAIPGADMVRSRPVQAIAQPVTAPELAGAHPIIGQQPLRPTAATAGVTPSVARAFHLPPTSPLSPAPGPAVQPRGPGATTGSVSNALVRPPLAVPGRVEPAAPANQSVAGSPPLQPNHTPVPTFASPVARTGVPPVSQPGQPAQVPPAVNRATEPGNIRPNGPATASPQVGAVPNAITRPNQRPIPQVVTPLHPEPQHVAPPPAPVPHSAAPAAVIHPEPPHATAPPAPAPHVAAPMQIARPEPQRFVPRQEPPHIAASAPAPHPQPPPPAPPERGKRPGEH